jgi:hypothetical protein
MTENTPVEPVPVVVVQKKKFWTANKKALVGIALTSVASVVLTNWVDKKILSDRSETSNGTEPSTVGTTLQS